MDLQRTKCCHVFLSKTAGFCTKISQTFQPNFHYRISHCGVCTWARVALVFNIEFQKIQVSSLQSLGKPYRYLIRLTYSDDPVWHVCEPPCCWNNHTICKQMPTGSCEKALRGHSKRRLGNSWEFLLKDRRWQYSDPSFMTPISSNQVTYAFSNVISTYLLFLFIEIIFDCVLDRSKPYIEEFKSEIS